MNNTPTTEDRIWAALSHLSALTLGIGIVLPIIGWADQRRKSSYASFQCLQALGYQSLGFTVWILGYLVVIIMSAVITLAMSSFTPVNGQNTERLLVPWMIVLFIAVFGFFALYLVLPIVAAVACAFGRDFRYPIMGHRLGRYLGSEPVHTAEEQTSLNEDHEIRWVAAMGHFSILIALWGMLAPLTAWLVYGKQSAFLKFQSIQTVVYQAGVTILYLGTVFPYLFGIIIISLMAVIGWTGNVRIDSPMGMVGIIFFGGSLLVLFVVMLFVPVLHLLGQWAGYRVLKGDNYYYPLIGRLIDKWMLERSPLEDLA